MHGLLLSIERVEDTTSLSVGVVATGGFILGAGKLLLHNSAVFVENVVLDEHVALNLVFARVLSRLRP